MKYAEFRAWIDTIKMDAGCADCGYRSHPAALHFDHVDHTEKRFTIAEAASRERDQVRAEIAKCVVRCANCHAIRTQTQGITRGRPRVEDNKAQLAFSVEAAS